MVVALGAFVLSAPWPSGAREWAVAGLFALVLGSLGWGALRHRTLPWFVLVFLTGVVGLLSFLDLVGLGEFGPSWPALGTAVSSVVVIHALFDPSARPRPEAWQEIRRHRRLLLSGAALTAPALAIDPAFGGDGTDPMAMTWQDIVILVSGAAIIVWMYLALSALNTARKRLSAARAGRAEHLPRT